MFETGVPDTFEGLRQHIVRMTRVRKRRKEAARRARGRRRSLRKSERDVVLSKTDGRCHICGGEIVGTWQADHVLAHSKAGRDEADNYLAAHRLCNNYRWDYEPEEFQLVLKLGVFARTQIKRRTRVGVAVGEAFIKHEGRRVRRRQTRT